MTVEYQKVWRTMNDLELVTSKICSAREIIDAAIDRLQDHQYDKAETMIVAAYEFLEYYLQEFDEKFKLAWQATVGDLRDGDKEAYDTAIKEREYYEGKSWNSFWEENYYPEEHQQYTEEELNAMCDKAASDEEKEKCREYNLREAEYYDNRVKLDAELEKIRQEGGYDWTPGTSSQDKKYKNQNGVTYIEYLKAQIEASSAWNDGWTQQHYQKIVDKYEGKTKEVKKWVLPVEEAKDVDTDETDYFVTFPDDLLQAAKLKEGDQVEWVDNNDGTYTIRKT